MDILQAFNQHFGLLATTLLLLGLCIGSFLNVVIYRLPVMMERQWRSDCCELLEVDSEARTESFNLATPNSRCPECDHQIRPWENIPLLSYMALRGRCSECGVKISLRYPIIELTSGLLAVLLGWHYAGADLSLLGALIFTWALLSLTMIDIDHQLLPDNITLPLLWLGLGFNLLGTYAPLFDAVVGAMAGYLSLWSVYWLFKLLTGKDGMGFGDFKLLAAIGAWLGWQALPMVILLSSLVGAVIGILMMFLQRKGRDVPIPFGPYLAIAGWIALIWGDPIMRLYWQTATGGS